MRRRTFLSGVTFASLSGCAGDVTVRQPTPTLARIDQYGSHQNIKVRVDSVRFEVDRCRVRISGSFTDIQWPESDVRLILFLYDGNAGVVHSADEVFEDVEPGQGIDFTFDRTYPTCDAIEGYEVVGRRLGR